MIKFKAYSIEKIYSFNEPNSEAMKLLSFENSKFLCIYNSNLLILCLLKYNSSIYLEQFYFNYYPSIFDEHVHKGVNRILDLKIHQGISRLFQDSIDSLAFNSMKAEKIKARHFDIYDINIMVYCIDKKILPFPATYKFIDCSYKDYYTFICKDLVLTNGDKIPAKFKLKDLYNTLFAIIDEYFIIKNQFDY